MNDDQIGKALIAQIEDNTARLEKLFAESHKLRTIARAAVNVIRYREDQLLDNTIYPYAQLTEALFALLKED